MHICFVVYEYLAHFNEPADLLKDYFSLTDWCEVLADNGCKISAIIRFKEDVHIAQPGIDYYFLKDAFGPRLKFWQIPHRLHQHLPTLQPDIVHSHNFNKVLQLRHLIKVIAGRQPILLQNHAEPPSYALRRLLQKRIFPQVSRFLLPARGQEQLWLKHQLLPADKLRYLIEASTHFEPQPRAAAQQQSGLHGDPVFLWVGNLNANKDPMTILSAFEGLLSKRPQARLYMIYRYDDMIKSIRQRIASSTALSGAVQMLGAMERSALPAYYNSAHYFILGSHREGSAYSAMEAIACGCVPIVTDIAAFRMLTDNGRIGALWPCGDVPALSAAIDEVLEQPWAEASARARQFFQKELSYPALSQKMITYYREMLMD